MKYITILVSLRGTLFGARYITRDSELLARGKHRTLYVCTGRVIYYWIIVTWAPFKSIRASGRSDLNHIGPYSIKLSPLFFADIATLYRSENRPI